MTAGRDHQSPRGSRFPLAEWCAAAGLFGMMMVTVVDVIGRYLFHAPLQASFELTEYLMSVLLFVALPLVSLRGEHVRITLIDDHLAPAARGWRDRATGLLAGLVCAVLGWRVAVLGLRLAEYGDTTQSLRLPLAPLAFFAALSLALSALILAIRPFLGGATPLSHADQ